MTALGAALGRVGAMSKRHLYLFRSSWTRVFDLVYWPVLQMTIWGFVTVFLNQQSSWFAQAAGVLIGAVLLWDVLVRSQFGLTLSLLEEMWSRNLANLFVSPLRPWEFAASLMLLAVARSMIGVLPAALLAIPLFAYSVFDLGLPLIAFWTMLVMLGWSIGLMIGALLFRFGLAAESYAWASIFVIQPISGVWYPVSVLPAWLQPLAWCLPSTYVFEGMRAVVIDKTFRWDLLAGAFVLNLVYMAFAFAAFLYAFALARRRGQLLQSSE
ncbi:MAG: ABC transporter permease [Azospirillum sp.]|nr:ABC transporter permease [Azospirillum sp.]